MGNCLNVVKEVTEELAEQSEQPQALAQPDESLKNMSLGAAVQRAFDLDHNRLRPDVDYKLDIQKGKKPYWAEDKASDPLFAKVQPAVWKKETYRLFIDLLDNYEAQTGKEESFSAKEQKEIDGFLKAVLATPVMKHCHAYCHALAPDKVPADQAGFQKLLYHIWFELYRRERSGKLDSSGFEHVFVGEIRDQVSFSSLRSRISTGHCCLLAIS